jgi:hypothetical protein
MESVFLYKTLNSTGKDQKRSQKCCFQKLRDERKLTPKRRDATGQAWKERLHLVAVK